MANSNVPMFIQTVQGWLMQLNNGSGTTPSTILTAGANGSRLTGLLATMTDTSTHDLVLSLLRSGTTYILGVVNIPVSSGNTNATPTINLLGNAQIPGIAYDSNGNPYMDFKAGDVLQAGILTGSLTSAKVLSVIGYGGDF